jgi:predicted aldo/keto reductase-like oxidoreductase
MTMQYRTDPQSGLSLSALGFGCMRFPLNAELREKLILDAIGAGVNYFDTAYRYPGSEAALGGILAKHQLREKVYIADKLPHSACKSAQDFERFFAETLKRLKTSYIDYYLIHNIGSKDAWERLEALGIREWIAQKKEQGAMRFIGFSFHGKSVDFIPLLDAYAWDFCQIQYNYMNEHYQAGAAGLRAIHERGMAAIIMEPLLGGKLAQKLPPKAKDRMERAVPGRSPAAWALQWLWDQPEVTVVLSGMNGLDQLSDNIETACRATSGALTPEERAVYAEARAAIEAAYKFPCTGCSYCMPCPAGVNIPASFEACNLSYAMGFIAGIQQYANATSLLKTGPGKCTQCGACVQKCPQNIQIPERLKDVRKHMEPLPVRAIVSLVGKVMK